MYLKKHTNYRDLRSEATAHKVEVKGVARASRPGPGRDALVTLPQLYEQLRSEQPIIIVLVRRVELPYKSFIYINMKNFIKIIEEPL